jgi:hypothetical protein
MSFGAPKKTCTVSKEKVLEDDQAIVIEQRRQPPRRWREDMGITVRRRPARNDRASLSFKKTERSTGLYQRLLTRIISPQSL